MPIYEFYSSDTNKIYTFYARSSAYAERTPRCPDGDGNAMQKLISGFSVTGGSTKDEDPSGNSEASDDPFSGMSETQMAAAMREMEKTVGSMDDENPDPRQMGHLMRKMAEMTGEKLDAGMEEVVRKLEEGADPDELEERMGDLFGDEADADGMQAGDGGSDPNEEGASKSLKSCSPRPKPSRDPEMYELFDYL